MRKQALFILFLLVAVMSKAGDNPPLSLSGTYLVGNGQPVYKKLSDVAAALNNAANTVTGDVIFELDSYYDGTTGESFPLTFNQFNSTGNWTVTIRPKAGVTMRTSSGDGGQANALITLNGTDRLVLDGRAGGTGDIKWLIRSTRAANPFATIFLQNDAQYNTLTYLQLEGAGEVIYLGSTSQTQGNDNNTISYCNIRDRSDVTTVHPSICIFSIGGTGDTTRFNSGTTIVHNNIFNFYYNGGLSFGVQMGAGTTRSLVAYNSFYQTRFLVGAAPGTNLKAIYINEAAAANTIVSDNFIGGSAPQCGGNPFLVIGAGIRFAAIAFDAPGPGTGKGNVVNNNTIRNVEINYSTPVSGSLFSGIQVFAGQVDVINNTIGNPDGNDDIALNVRSGTDSFYCTIIDFASNAGGSITGNKIVDFTIGTNYEITNACTFNAINASFNSSSSLAFPISDNIVSNIYIPSERTPVHFNGILTNISGRGGVNCKKNTITGVFLGYIGYTYLSAFKPVTVTPINLTASSSIVADSNLVSDISSASLTLTDPNNVIFAGIMIRSGTDQTISNNTISGLRQTFTANTINYSLAHNCVCGIYMPGASGTARIYNNRLYDFTSEAVSFQYLARLLTGMDIRQSAIIYNNLIALTNGFSTSNCGIRGIRLNSIPAITVNILHNTIYIGGESWYSDGNFSCAIDRSGSGASGFIRNNVLVNERIGGSPFIFADTTRDNNWTLTTSDYNLVVTGSTLKVGLWGNPAIELDSAEWKTTGGDGNSSFYTTAQIAPSDLFTDITVCDLSIKDSARQYVAGKGTGGTGITTDYAGMARDATRPGTGAYEYRFDTVNAAPAITSYGGAATVTLQVPENTTAVATLTATDTDAGTTLIYSLGGGEDAANFKVDSSTGMLSFITAPDFEVPGDANGDNAYIVAVQVSDGDSTATQRFKIKVTDANDHAPVITSYGDAATVTLRVEENTRDSAATVTATDADRNTTITYSLVNEEDAAKFTIDPFTGVLGFITAPDFEQPGDSNGDNVYIVTVKASDGDSSAVQWFRIKVTNVNDNTPVITSHNGDALVSLQLPENTIQVATVTATDPDSTPVIYSILGEKDGALFIVNPSTGELSFVTAPDFEHPADPNSDNVYLVSVKTSDGSFSAVQRFSIKITDINDSPPVVTMTVQIPENTVEVTPLEGTDEDAGSTVTFTMVDKEDGALFWINPASGSLEFKAAPDFENPADADHDNTYLVSVKMTAGDIITILRFKVKVTDTEEGAGRTAGRYANGPEMQQPLVGQTEPQPGKGIKAYPNPVTGKRFTLQMGNIPGGRFSMEIYTATGQLVYLQQLDHTGKTVNYPIQLPATLSRGVYVLLVTGTHTRYTQNLMID
jgi:hypothetical protein